jgi:ribonuclease HII
VSTGRISLSAFDHSCRDEGFRWIAGIDEAGRGCLAGPVVAACVVLADGVALPGVTDSKQLTPAQRVTARELVCARAAAYAWCFVGPRTIDTINIRRSSLLAMRRSLARSLVGLAQVRGGAMPPAADVLALVDGVDEVPGATVPQRALIGGDGRSLAVAAASIVAKTVRDAFMTRLASEHPAYGFDRHKGYGTPDHLAALDRHGPCPWHRFSYAPVAQVNLFDFAP